MAILQPRDEVAEILYCTDPAVKLLGLVRTWLIIDPEPALAPVIPPVIVPIVQENVLATLAVRLMLVFEPLHTLFVERLVTMGKGFTITVRVNALPVHEPAVETGVMI